MASADTPAKEESKGNGDWKIEDPDESKYNFTDEKGVWQPKPEDILILFEKLAGGGPLPLKWQCPGRRQHKSKEEVAEESVKEGMEVDRDEEAEKKVVAPEVSAFDFDEFASDGNTKLTPKRAPGGSGRTPRTEKRVAKMDNIMDSLRRQQLQEREARRARGSPSAAPRGRLLNIGSPAAKSALSSPSPFATTRAPTTGTAATPSNSKAPTLATTSTASALGETENSVAGVGSTITGNKEPPISTSTFAPTLVCATTSATSTKPLPHVPVTGVNTSLGIEQKLAVSTSSVGSCQDLVTPSVSLPSTVVVDSLSHTAHSSFVRGSGTITSTNRTGTSTLTTTSETISATEAQPQSLTTQVIVSPALMDALTSTSTSPASFGSTLTSSATNDDQYAVKISVSSDATFTTTSSSTITTNIAVNSTSLAVTCLSNKAAGISPTPRATSSTASTTLTAISEKSQPIPTSFAPLTLSSSSIPTSDGKTYPSSSSTSPTYAAISQPSTPSVLKGSTLPSSPSPLTENIQTTKAESVAPKTISAVPPSNNPQEKESTNSNNEPKVSPGEQTMQPKLS